MTDDVEDRVLEQLVRAGAVAPPSHRVFDDAQRVLREEVREAPRAARRGVRPPLARGVAAAALVGVCSLGGILGAAQFLGTGGGSTDSNQATDSHGLPSPSARPSHSATWVIDTNSDRSALIRQFFLPSLQKFAADPLVADVVIGTVESVTSGIADGPGGEVITTVRLQVEQARVAAHGDMVTAVEPGGVVPASAVREGIAQHLGRRLADSELDKLVEYRIDAREPMSVGETVLVFLRADAFTGPGHVPTPGILGRMTADLNGIGWTWAGDVPNPEWSRTMTVSEAQALMN